jgi:hypothetical protein
VFGGKYQMNKKEKKHKTYWKRRERNGEKGRKSGEY